MKKNVVTTTYYEREDVKEVTLLSIEQAKELPKEVLSCNGWWWLRSPGYTQYDAAYVNGYGDVCEFGGSVYNGYFAVRPAFVISNLEDENGKIYVGKIPCTKIDKDLVLTDEPIYEHCFDSHSNNWKTSKLKQFIESNEFWDRFIEEGE